MYLKEKIERVQKKGLPVPSAVGIKRVLGGERGGGDHDADQQEVGNDLRRSWSWWWCCCHYPFIKLTHSSINKLMLVIVFLSVISFVTVIDCICLIFGQVKSLWSIVWKWQQCYGNYVKKKICHWPLEFLIRSPIKLYAAKKVVCPNFFVKRIENRKRSVMLRIISYFWGNRIRPKAPAARYLPTNGIEISHQPFGFFAILK